MVARGCEARRDADLVVALVRMVGVDLLVRDLEITPGQLREVMLGEFLLPDDLRERLARVALVLGVPQADAAVASPSLTAPAALLVDESHMELSDAELGFVIRRYSELCAELAALRRDLAGFVACARQSALAWERSHDSLLDDAVLLGLVVLDPPVPSEPFPPFDAYSVALERAVRCVTEMSSHAALLRLLGYGELLPRFGSRRVVPVPVRRECRLSRLVRLAWLSRLFRSLPFCSR